MNDHDQELDDALVPPIRGQRAAVRPPGLRRAWEAANDAAEEISQGKIESARCLRREALRNLDTAEKRRAPTR